MAGASWVEEEHPKKTARTAADKTRDKLTLIMEIFLR